MHMSNKRRLEISMDRTVGLFGDEDLCELISSAIGKSSLNEWKTVDVTPIRFRAGMRMSPFNLLSLFLELYRRFKNVDVVVFIFVGKYAPFFSKIARLAKTKVVYCWIGSDVYRLQKEGHEKTVADFRAAADLHLADGEALQQELHCLGIDSMVIYIVPSLKFDVSSMPSEHAVLLNIPDSRTRFYNLDTCLRLACDYPDLKFVAVRSEDPSLYPNDNIEFKGSIPYDEMTSVYDQVSIILRIPDHDSLSLVSMEGIARGKWIISRSPFPSSLPAGSYEELKASLDSLLSGPPQINSKGIEYYKEHFTQEKSGDSMICALDSLFNKS